MSGYLPDGCIDASDLDYHDRMNRWAEEKEEEPEPELEDRCDDCGAGAGEKCDSQCVYADCTRQDPRTEAK